MSTYRTIAEVHPGGLLHLLGLPFATGAKVQVTVEPSRQPQAVPLDAGLFHPALAEVIGILPADIDPESEAHELRLSKHQ